MASIQDLSDSELINVANQLISTMTADPAAYGTTAPQIASLTTLTTTFDTDLTAQVAAIAASKASTATKEGSRRPLVDAMRGHRDTAKASGASEAQMAATALPFGGEKVPPTATVPVGAVDTRNRLQHTISWTEATTPDNKRRPRGAMGAEIYVKLDGAPPIDEKECTFVTVDSATPYVAQYDGANAGKMAHYLMRWRMRDGSTGPWSETLSATITG
ncbi:MAG: hypothetical protein WBO10_14850 [Pyrinomonadaceae bacterium]